MQVSADMHALVLLSQNRIDCHYWCVNAVFRARVTRFEHMASCSVFLFVVIVVVKTYFENKQLICFFVFLK